MKHFISNARSMVLVLVVLVIVSGIGLLIGRSSLFDADITSVPTAPTSVDGDWFLPVVVNIKYQSNPYDIHKEESFILEFSGGAATLYKEVKSEGVYVKGSIVGIMEKHNLQQSTHNVAALYEITNGEFHLVVVVPSGASASEPPLVFASLAEPFGLGRIKCTFPLNGHDITVTHWTDFWYVPDGYTLT